jgi:hypothetical protein
VWPEVREVSTLQTKKIPTQEAAWWVGYLGCLRAHQVAQGSGAITALSVEAVSMTTVLLRRCRSNLLGRWCQLHRERAR